MDPRILSIIEIMNHSMLQCPDDVKCRIASLKVSQDEVSGTRCKTDWRRGGTDRNKPRENSTWNHEPPATQGPGPRMLMNRGRGGVRAHIHHFGNKSRGDVTTEERIMDRIRDKMNKISPLTYDATKHWLEQLLDNGETDFLTEFITLVFEKAAAEQSYCSLYAQLISELCIKFTHLNTDLRRIFVEFMNVFIEAADEPDISTSEYKLFVLFRERRRFRRGYAAFIGEVARRGVALTPEDVNHTCNIIIDQFICEKNKVGKEILCEEFADCLTSLVKSSSNLIDSRTLLKKVNVAMDRSTPCPSLTNKARFSLMDISDLFSN